MTKSTGVGRGGTRPGAGRKKALGAAVIAKAKKAQSEKAEPLSAAPKPQPAIVAPPAATPDNPHPETARSLRGLALATLKEIMEHGQIDGPRVSAAKEVLIRADAEDEAEGTKGKKALQAARVDELSKPGNRFAVRHQFPSAGTGRGN